MGKPPTNNPSEPFRLKPPDPRPEPTRPSFPPRATEVEPSLFSAAALARPPPRRGAPGVPLWAGAGAGGGRAGGSDGGWESGVGE